MRDVRKPKEPPPRTRRISDDEIERLCYALGYEHDAPPKTISARVGMSMLFAIETAMRIGEITGLDWKHVHLDDRYVHIPKTKNGHPRDVPLSTEAIRLLDQLPSKKGVIFELTTRQADALFRKAKTNALVENLHFHDTRREALSRLAKKYGVMDLAKVSGHRDLRILQSVYYAPTISDLVAKLD